MSDTTLNQFISRGTNAQRLAFTPSPATPASGNNPSYIFYETDTGNTYMWDGSQFQKINTGGASGPIPAGLGGWEGMDHEEVIVPIPGQFSTNLPGLVPQSGGGTTNFLRADGTWAVPSGSSVATPGTISDLLYWFESSNILASSGAAINSLQNLCPWYTGFFAPISGSGGTSSGATMDSSTLNSLPVINTAGTSASRYAWFTAATAAMLLTNSTTFVVFKPNAFSNGVSGAFICGTVNSFEFRMGGTATAGQGNLEILKTAVASIGTSTAGGLSAGTWYQANVTYASGTGAYAFRVARASAGSGTNAQSITTVNNGVFYNPQTNAEDLNAKIAALIVYNRVLNGTEITNVENYLNTKYGV